MAEAGLAGARWPTAERCPACTLDRLAMACKAAAAERTDPRKEPHKERRPVGTAKLRMRLAGTGRTSADIELVRMRTGWCTRLPRAAADRLHARSVRLCCPLYWRLERN